MIRTLEVRCCCDPNKVLGELAHPRLQALGDRVHFPMIDLAPFNRSRFTGVWPAHRQITLEVAEIVDPLEGVQLAIKNSDYPMADLERIPGFLAR